jgi:ABC-type multidrug transport system ATPase subunit
VSQDHSLADILSEGEQKVIAIADFLAEASLRTGSAPIIFDDPVNSLDHRRVREIAKRIAELSAEHQVVVFTHDIWLATELLSAFDDTPGDCSSYLIREEGGIKGLVSGEKHPRSDTVASIGKRINAKIQDAASGNDEGRQERIDSTYDLIRTWCERVVEHVLLKKVAQRFQPNVAMQNLNDIHADRLGTAISTIYPIWEKACRYMTGHSQPMDTLGIRATVTELKQDWADLQQSLTDYEGS